MEDLTQNKIEIKGLFTKSQIPSFPKIGDMVEGRLIEKSGKSLFVDLGNLGIGMVFGDEYDKQSLNLEELEIGDSIFAKIVNPENEEGYVELSLKEAGKDLSWEKLQEKMKNKEILEVEISKANWGGLTAEIYGITAFLPVSQLSFEHYPRVENGNKEKIFEELKKFIGKTLRVQIIDLGPKENKLIISERAESQEKLKETLKKYKVGDIVEGQVGGIVDFGVFLRFPLESPEKEKLEGLAHISELDHKLIKNPRDVVRAGEIVKAKIIDIKNNQISLSIRALKEDPWKGIKEKYKKGGVVSGRVTKFNPFGAFIELLDGLQGLLHISEFGSEKKMKEAIEIGKIYNFKVLLVDPEAHKIALGLSSETSEREQQ